MTFLPRNTYALAVDRLYTREGVAMEAHQHTPNPYDNVTMSRREAFIGLASLTALVAGATAVDHVRSHITKMTPSQRQYVKDALTTNAS